MTESTFSQKTQALPRLYPRAFLRVTAVIWWPLYQSLIPASESIAAALGTVLAFMMSMIAPLPPEMTILRKVLKVRLIAPLVGIVATGILITGFVFNAVL